MGSDTRGMSLCSRWCSACKTSEKGRFRCCSKGTGTARRSPCRLCEQGELTGPGCLASPVRTPRISSCLRCWRIGTCAESAS
eukprot:719866-Amphidinium_carterae.2